MSASAPVGDRDLVYRTLPGGGAIGCGFIAKPDPAGVMTEFPPQPRYSAVLVLEGGGEYRERGRRLPLRPGDLVHRLPDRHHWTLPDGDGRWREFFLLLPPSWAEAMQDGGLPLREQPVWHPGVERRLLAELTAFLPALRAAADAELPQLALAMAGWLGLAHRAHRAGAGAEDRRLEIARRRLASDLDREFGLADLARGLGMRPDAFRRWFAHAAGCPPGAYRLRARLDQARLLLATTAMPIAAVAVATGFRDRYAFTRRFAAAAGIAPAAFRRAHGG